MFGTLLVKQDRGIILKSAREIELMREAGRVVRRVLRRMEELAKPGVTTGQLNTVAEEMIAEAGGTPLFKGVENPPARFPFPAALCTSINEELVHGIPGDRVLEEGDLLSIDCGVRLAGYCGDSAVTIPIGEVADEIKHLVEVTEKALYLAIDRIRPHKMWSEVARRIQAYVEGEGLSIVRKFVGHGIGRELHEDPKVPNYWVQGQEKMDFKLSPNLVIAVEPMVNLGGQRVRFGDDDGWVVVTKDGKSCAHFEHTVAVTKDGVDVLTDGR